MESIETPTQQDFLGTVASNAQSETIQDVVETGGAGIYVGNDVDEDEPADLEAEHAVGGGGEKILKALV